MSSILNDILQAEKRAREGAENAEKLKMETYAFVEEEKKRIISEKIEAAKAEAERLHNEKMKQIEDGMKASQADTQAKLQKLKTIEAECFDAWTDKIFNDVING